MISRDILFVFNRQLPGFGMEQSSQTANFVSKAAFAQFAYGASSETQVYILDSISLLSDICDRNVPFLYRKWSAAPAS